MNIHGIDFTFTFIILVLIEITGLKMMIPFFYRFGIPFHKESFTKNAIINYELNKTIIKSAGKYKFVSNFECIFTGIIHLRFFSFDDITISSNICRIYGNKIEIISRIPIVLSLYIIYSFLKLLTIDKEFFELLKINKIEFYDFIFPIAGLVFAVILYFLELNKISIMKKELNELLFNKENLQQK